MNLNYKPADGWAADFIPFYWNGEYHLFYLKDYRDRAAQGEGTPWFHLVTRDFVDFTDLGECLERGEADAQDLYVFTGSAIHGEGQFHIFYTGHNPHFPAQGLPKQAIMHATSNDLIHWTKVPADTFFAPLEMFEQNDWRDPFVFWNAAAGEYWMLTAARLKHGPSRRRGCTALCISRDLRAWEVKGPYYTPDLYYTHECPDLFRMGDWWYLLFSEFSESYVTRYRMARSLQGPWLTPLLDTFDGRAFYAAKTASDGACRFLFGWNPTRRDSKDSQPWEWGGNLVVHEVAQEPDGTLSVRIPDTVAASFSARERVTFADAIGKYSPDDGKVILEARDSFACVSAGRLPDFCMLDVTLRFAPDTHGCGVMLRSSSDFETGYYVRLEPVRSRLVFDSWPRPGDLPHMVELERSLELVPDTPVRLNVYVNGSVCEVYVNETVAMSARMYDHHEAEWGLFVSQGSAEFSDISLARPGTQEAR